MANAIFNYFKKALLAGSFNLSAAQSPSMYVALVSNSYALDIDLHQYRSSLTNVVTPSNYVAYFALSSPSVVLDTGVNQGILFASNMLMANVTFGTSVRAMVLFGSTPSGAASDPLYAYLDFGADYSVTAGTFTMTFDPLGVLALT